MPGYRGHLVGGAVAYGIMLVPTIIVKTIAPVVAIEWLICALAGSLFPDIDIKSKGQKYFYYAIIILLLWLMARAFYVHALGVSLLAMTPMLVKHRGIFHRYWFVIGVPLVIWFGFYIYFAQTAKLIFLHVVFFIVGAISHILLDYRFGYLPFFNLSFFGKHAKRKK